MDKVNRIRVNSNVALWHSLSECLLSNYLVGKRKSLELKIQ